MNTEHFTDQEIADAIQTTQGFITKAADLLGCTAQTIYNYAEKYPAVRGAIKEAREKRHDFVENKMMQRIKEGSDTMIIFYAKTQMKERGYIERHEFRNVTWQDEVIELLRSGRILPEDVAAAFPDLASEFFAKAGIHADSGS